MNSTHMPENEIPAATATYLGHIGPHGVHQQVVGFYLISNNLRNSALSSLTPAFPINGLIFAPPSGKG